METPFNGIQWKTWIARLVALTLLAAALASALWAVHTDVTRRAQEFTPNVALVNEDLPGKFNGEEYTFGASFVDRISKDTEYNWTVTSRPVAEKAYKDGSVDAVVYLPQSFTQDLLTLQELSPTKAKIEYKLQPQADERADRLLDNKIAGIVSDFNRGVVQMYSASIADNVAEADGQMYASLGNQEALVNALTTDIQEPFSGTMPSFDGFIKSTSALKDVNSNTLEAHNKFTETVTETLSSTGAAFSDSLPQIDEYLLLQKEIAQINAANSNLTLAEQSVSDHDFYSGQFDTFRMDTFYRLNGTTGTEPVDTDPPCLYEQNSDMPPLCQQIAELSGSIAAASKIVEAAEVAQKSLEPSISNLTDLMDSLQSGDPVEPDETVNQEVLETLQAAIDELDLALKSLNESFGDPNESFDLSANLSHLEDWYNKSLQTTEAASLSASTANNLELKDWTTYDPDNRGLYVDNSDGLHQNVTGLVTQSTATSNAISNGKLTVPDNSSLFDALMNSATATFTGADTIFNGTNDLVESGNTALNENQHYYQNFSTVLANTRTQGADTNKIHDFLSAPIDAKNVTPPRPIIAESFDPTLAFAFGGGLVAGIMAMTLGRTFHKKNRTKTD